MSIKRAVMQLDQQFILLNVFERIRPLKQTLQLRLVCKTWDFTVLNLKKHHFMTYKILCQKTKRLGVFITVCVRTLVFTVLPRIQLLKELKMAFSGVDLEFYRQYFEQLNHVPKRRIGLQVAKPSKKLKKTSPKISLRKIGKN